MYEFLTRWMLENEMNPLQSEDQFYPALRSGALLFDILHAHLTPADRPAAPPEALDCWFAIIDILSDSGVLVTEKAMFHALYGDTQTLDDLVKVVFTLYHPGAESVPVPFMPTYEPQVSYPIFIDGIMTGATTCEEFMRRLGLQADAQNAPGTTAERELRWLKVLEEYLDRLVGFPDNDTFVVFLVNKFNNADAQVSTYSFDLLLRVLEKAGDGAAFNWFVLSSSPNLTQAQDELVSLLKSPTISPRLAHDLQQLVIRVSSPDKFIEVMEKLLLPRMDTNETIQFAFKMLATGDPVVVSGLGKMSELALAVATKTADAEGSAEALVLLLRMWSEYAFEVESLGLVTQLLGILRSENGRSQCTRQDVLSELCSVVLVCSEMYNVLLDCLAAVFKHTYQRRLLMRALMELHRDNPNIAISSLVNVVVTGMVGVQCGVAEGEFMVSVAHHPQVRMWNPLTEQTLNWIVQVVEVQPFLHSHCVTAAAILAANLANDTNFLLKIKEHARSFLMGGESHEFGQMHVHFIRKLFAIAPKKVQKALADVTNLFVQQYLRISVIKMTTDEQLMWDAGLRQCCSDMGLPFVVIPMRELDGDGAAEEEEEEKAPVEEAPAEEKPVTPQPEPEPEPKPEEKKQSPRKEPTPEPEDDTPPADASPRKEPTTPRTPVLSPMRGRGFVSHTIDSNPRKKDMPPLRGVGKVALAKWSEKKVREFVHTQVVMNDIVGGVFDEIARRAYHNRVKQHGLIPPTQRVANAAKRAHEARIEAERQERERQRLEEEHRKDYARMIRDRRLKAAVEESRMQQQQQAHEEVTHLSKEIMEHEKNMNELKQQAAMATKKMLEEHRRAKEEAQLRAREEEERRREEEAEHRRLEAERREMLKTKLQEYFTAKQMKEQESKRSEWEEKMQKEFDERLRKAEYSQQQKMKLQAWKEQSRAQKEQRRREMEEQTRREQEEEARRARAPVKAKSATRVKQPASDQAQVSERPSSNPDSISSTPQKRAPSAVENSRPPNDASSPEAADKPSSATEAKGSPAPSRGSQKPGSAEPAGSGEQPQETSQPAPSTTPPREATPASQKPRTPTPAADQAPPQEAVSSRNATPAEAPQPSSAPQQDQEAASKPTTPTPHNEGKPGSAKPASASASEKPASAAASDKPGSAAQPAEAQKPGSAKPASAAASDKPGSAAQPAEAEKPGSAASDKPGSSAKPPGSAPAEAEKPGSAKPE